AVAPVAALAAPTTSAAATGLVVVVGLGVDRVGVHDQTAALAVLTRGGERLDQPGPELLARELHEPQRGDLGDLVAGAVATERLGEPTEHEVAVGFEHHVDEIDD